MYVIILHKLCTYTTVHTTHVLHQTTNATKENYRPYYAKLRMLNYRQNHMHTQHTQIKLVAHKANTMM